MSAELDIIVVGGGISGLAAAITLSRAGHRVRLLEQSSFKREAGFMITLGANAIRVLISFGFDFARARAVPTDYVDQYDGATLERIRHFPLDVHNTVFGKNPNVKTSTFYRPDLHNELKRIALLQSNDFKCPTICLGSRVASVDIETATVYLEDGTSMSADLIVGADGERSVIKAAFNDPETLRMAPYRIYRAIIPTKELVSNDKSKSLLALTKGSFAMFPHGDRTLSWFEGRDGLLQDLDLGYLLRPGDEPRGERDPSKAREKMLERFNDFHPDIVDVLRKTKFVADYEVYFNKPLQHFFKGKAVLIGDAAHSMFPATGQGGSQSMEDAGALGTIFSHLPSTSSLPERLHIYEKLRKERTTAVQMLSGLIFGQEEGWVRDRPDHFIQSTGIRSGEDHLELLYNYDIIAESEKALEKGTRVMAQL